MTTPIPDAVARAAARFRRDYPAHFLIFNLPGRRVVFAPGSEPAECVTLSAAELERDLTAAGKRVAVRQGSAADDERGAA